MGAVFFNFNGHRQRGALFAVIHLLDAVWQMPFTEAVDPVLVRLPLLGHIVWVKKYSIEPPCGFLKYQK